MVTGGRGLRREAPQGPVHVSVRRPLGPVQGGLGTLTVGRVWVHEGGLLGEEEPKDDEEVPTRGLGPLEEPVLLSLENKTDVLSLQEDTPKTVVTHDRVATVPDTGDTAINIGGRDELVVQRTPDTERLTPEDVTS